jgi:hypothetical protein
VLDKPQGFFFSLHNMSRLVSKQILAQVTDIVSSMHIVAATCGSDGKQQAGFNSHD